MAAAQTTNYCLPAVPQPSLLSVACGTGIAISLLAWALDDHHRAASAAMLVIFISGFTAYSRLRDKGLDPLGVFCVGFFFYDGILLLRLATIGDGARLPYPAGIGPAAYSKAGVLTVIAAATIAFTAAVWDRVAPPFGPGKAISGTNARAWFYAGAFVFSLGIILYFLQYRQIGGYIAALSTGRGDRFDAFGNAALSYPYGAFVVPGIACMYYGAQVARCFRFRIIGTISTIMWCVLVMLPGDRRLAVQAILAVLALISILEPKRLRPRGSTLMLGAVAIALLCVYGYVRGIVSDVASGYRSAAAAVELATTDTGYDWILPENTELAGPYYSLLYAVSNDSIRLHGSSYTQSLLTALPRFLYPGTKPIPLTDQFSRTVHRGRGPVSGWGFNLVAEAFMNFGYVGVPLVACLWALFFLCLGAVRHRTPIGTLIFAVLLPEALNANRIDFRIVYWESSYIIGGVLVAVLLQGLLFRQGEMVRLNCAIGEVAG